MGRAGTLTRRTMLASGLATGFASAATLRAFAEAGWPAGAGRKLAFRVMRNGSEIGRHTLAFQGDGGDFTVAIDAVMLVKFGPIPVFHYHHQGAEVWRGGRFVSLQTQTISNGWRQQVQATRTAAGVTIQTSPGRTLTAPANTLPMTHWNQAALDGPLFNPQTGALMHEQVSRQLGQTAQLADGRSVAATAYKLNGDADIEDWYDAGGVWTALRGKVQDGSYVQYLRLT